MILTTVRAVKSSTTALCSSCVRPPTFHPLPNQTGMPGTPIHTAAPHNHSLLPPPRSRVLYHGPVSDVVPHFRSLGLECPDRKDVPSFLLEITTPLGQRQYAGPELRQRFNLPPPGVDLVPARWGGGGAGWEAWMRVAQALT